MIAAALWLGLVWHGVVDQIDAGWASVEWEGRAFGFLPVELLPAGVGEGDRVVLRARPSRRGRPLSLPTDFGPVEMPPEVAPRGWRVVVTSGSTERERRTP